MPPQHYISLKNLVGKHCSMYLKAACENKTSNAIHGRKGVCYGYCCENCLIHSKNNFRQPLSKPLGLQDGWGQAWSPFGSSALCHRHHRSMRQTKLLAHVCNSASFSAWYHSSAFPWYSRYCSLYTKRNRKNKSLLEPKLQNVWPVEMVDM